MSTKALEDTTTAEDAALEASMREQAHEVDAARTLDNNASDESDAAEQQIEQTGTDAPEVTPKDAGTEQALKQTQQQQTKKTDDGKPKTDATTTKPETAAEKARKENERRERSWQNLQAEKEKLRAEREEFYRNQAAALSKQPAQQQQQTRKPETANGPARIGDTYSAQELEDAATRFEERGNYESARAAREEARYAREREARPTPAQQTAAGAQAQTQQQQGDDPVQQQRFMAEWKANLAAAEREMPDLANKESELYQATAQVIRQYPYFSSSAKGAHEAAQLAAVQIKARAVPGLEAKLKEYEAEITKLRKATSPGGGSNAESRGAPRSFEQMSMADQEATILRLANEEDARATA